MSHHLHSLRSLYVTSATVVVGATLTIVDGTRQADCDKSMTWLGYLGWTLVALGTIAGMVALNEQLLEHKRAFIPVAIGLLALCGCVCIAAIYASLSTLCGINWGP